MASLIKIDLNCDLGEGFGRYSLGQDAAMMQLVTSANVACGFHAGDPSVIERMVALANQHGVALGAHPGYPDLQGFGRRAMGLSPEEIANSVIYQIGALAGFARVAGMQVVHVKPHGALYNLAALDPAAARAIAQAVVNFDPELILVGLAGSELTKAGEAVGLRVASEGFPDRAYLPDGQLMPRSQEGAVITQPEVVAANALRLAREGIIIGSEQVRLDTLCLHGDNPGAVENAKAVRKTLEEAGIEIRPLEA
jgi:UPF0271 protein